MSDFFKSFLTDDRRSRAEGPQIYLAVFGKHPGWNDHIESLGLDTPSLIMAKNLLYTQGIGGQIDSGAWEKLEPEQRTAGFNHLFLWLRGEQFLLGNLWSSSDGKGRTRYPMILCAHCAGAPVSWAMHVVLPALEAMRQQCQAVPSAREVVAILASRTTELRQKLAAGAPGETPLTAAERKAFLDCPTLGPQGEGWRRIIHQVGSQMSGYMPEARGLSSQTTTRGVDLRPQQIRLPQCAPAGRSLALWREFFRLTLNRNAPLLLMDALDQPWIDATVGEPGTHEFFALRATASKIPLASSIPYTVDEAVKRQAEELAASFLTGGQAPAAPTSKDAPAGGTSSPTPKKRGLNLGFFTGGIVALALAAVLLLHGQHGTNRTAVQPGNVPLPAKAQPAAEAKTRQEAEAKRLAAEKARADEAARLTAAAEAKTRQEAEVKRLAEEKARADEAARLLAAEAKTRQEAETKRLAEEKARADEAARFLAAAEAKTRQEAEAKRLAAEKARADEAARQASLASRANTTTSTASIPPQPAAASGGGPISFDNTIGIALVWVPSLGSGVGKFEITEQQYEQVMHTNPSAVLGSSLPVQNVTGLDAAQFCARLTDLQRAAGTLPRDWKYALPTERQFEIMSTGTRLEDSVASVGLKESRKAPEPVGQWGKPNNLGLYDVRGNVWEWCLADDVGMVPRGGGFESVTDSGFFFPHGRFAIIKPANSSPYVGFRVLVTPTASVKSTVAPK